MAHISEQKTLWFFAQVDRNNSKTLSRGQWVSFMTALLSESQQKVLSEVGFDVPTIGKHLALNIVILLILFAFIFFGIAGFAVAGSFGACINSALPVLTGGGMGGEDMEERIEKAKEKVISMVKKKLGVAADEEAAD